MECGGTNGPPDYGAGHTGLESNGDVTGSGGSSASGISSISSGSSSSAGSGGGGGTKLV
jgi:hypothetical protein